MTAITLTTFQSRVRSIGNYENSSKVTSALLTEVINDAVGEYCDLLDERWEGYRETVSTVSTVAGTATVALPSSFLKARAVELLDGTRYVPLTRLSLRQSQGFDTSQTGKPSGYMLRGAYLELFATPDAVYTIRLRYVPTATVLASGSDSLDVPNGWELFIIYSAIAALDRKWDKPIGEAEGKIEQIRQRIIRASADRGAAEPEYLVSPWPSAGTDPFR